MKRLHAAGICDCCDAPPSDEREEPSVDLSTNHDLELLLEWLNGDGRTLWADAVRRLRAELEQVKRERDIYDWRWRSLEARR